MKYILLIIATILVIAVVTKPSDQECISLLKDKMESSGGLEGEIGSLFTGRLTVQIEDYIFFKRIYSRIDGHLIGYGIFNTVFI